MTLIQDHASAESSAPGARAPTPAEERAAGGVPGARAGQGLITLWATLGIALAGITTNKARTTLTLLGVVIGVASVITAVGIGAGSAAQVNAQISSLGTNLVTVQPGGTFSGGVRGGAGSANTLTQSDVNAMEGQIGPNGALPDVALIAPEATTSVQVVAGKNNSAAQADGVTPAILTARNYQVAVGRFITQDDVNRSAQVADLGMTLAQQMFPTGLGNAIGATIELNGQSVSGHRDHGAQRRLWEHRHQRLRPHPGGAEPPLPAHRRG